MVEAIRKKYFPAPQWIASNESDDFQISASPSESPLTSNEEVQVQVPVLDQEVQTDEEQKRPVKLPPRPFTPIGKKDWNAHQVPSDLTLDVVAERIPGSQLERNRPISRRRLRKFDEFLMENPALTQLIPTSVDLCDVFERDSELFRLEEQQRAVSTALYQVTEEKLSLVT